MIRWQATAEAFLKRFADLTTGPDRLRELAPFVVPVIMLGADATDAARSTFWASEQIAAVAGQGGVGVLAAVDSDLEIRAAWFSGGAAQNVSVTLLPSELVFGFAPTSTIEQQSGASPSNAATLFTTAVNGAASDLESPLNTTTEVPGVQGMILAKGKCLVVRGNLPNTTLRVGFAWRNAL